MHDAAGIQGRTMKFVGWTATVLAVCALAWLVAASEVVGLRIGGTLMLVGIGMLIGMRLGIQSATAYIADLHRLNKTLSDQQQELEDANAMLLKHATDQLAATTSSKSA